MTREAKYQAPAAEVVRYNSRLIQAQRSKCCVAWAGGRFSLHTEMRHVDQPEDDIDSESGEDKAEAIRLPRWKDGVKLWRQRDVIDGGAGRRCRLAAETDRGPLGMIRGWQALARASVQQKPPRLCQPSAPFTAYFHDGLRRSTLLCLKM